MLRIRKFPIVLFFTAIYLFPPVSSLIPAIEYYPDVMVFAGIYCLITIGLSLLMGYAGQISLGHAAFYGIGAYVSAIGTVHSGLNPWVCMILGMVITGGVAFLIGTPALKLKGHYLAMATLAFGIIIYIVFNEETRWTGGPDGLNDIPGLSILGFALDSTVKYFYLVWTLVLVFFVFSTNLIQSGMGRAFRAIHASETAAMGNGVDVARYKIIIFVFSAMLASLAGSLYAHYLNFINPSSFDLNFAVRLLIMIALGGMHNIWGALVGAIIVTFLSNEWLHYFDEFEVVVYGLILLLITILLPEGVVGLTQTFNRKQKSQRP